MKQFFYIFTLLLVSCGEFKKEDNRFDRMIVLSSDTSYINDISWKMDNLLEIFYQDSSQFSIIKPKQLKNNQVDSLFKDLDELKVYYYARKNPYIQEYNFCKKWQIVLFREQIQQCDICIDTNSMLMSIRDSIFKINREKFYKSKALKEVYPKSFFLNHKYYSSELIYIKE
ncbi:hypothetical protein [Sphingobacterium multivorum]|uniref:hypothetical protein n=1 Tax=Sphingobacterium multivorum TaxID=28454 RepID=UPI0028ACA63E|nr:hypothetical protein [Sphingobacterium multivorum]